MSPVTHFDLWTVALVADKGELRAGKPEPFLRTQSIETYPTFSPDGHWLAYASNQSGPFEVYVRAFPDNGAQVQVSSGGGRIPRWSRRGGDLFYSTDDQRIMVAAYRVNGGSFQADRPRLWSQRRLGDTGVLPDFYVAPDGRRVPALLSSAGPAPQPAPNHRTLM